jgi:hypothetical protein
MCKCSSGNSLLHVKLVRVFGHCRNDRDGVSAGCTVRYFSGSRNSPRDEQVD